MNSGSHACTTGTLLTEPSFKPPKCTFMNLGGSPINNSYLCSYLHSSDRGCWVWAGLSQVMAIPKWGPVYVTVNGQGQKLRARNLLGSSFSKSPSDSQSCQGSHSPLVPGWLLSVLSLGVSKKRLLKTGPLKRDAPFAGYFSVGCMKAWQSALLFQSRCQQGGLKS